MIYESWIEISLKLINKTFIYNVIYIIDVFAKNFDKWWKTLIKPKILLRIQKIALMCWYLISPEPTQELVPCIDSVLSFFAVGNVCLFM